MNSTLLMTSKLPFKWRHFQQEIILLNVGWYCRYPLSYRNLEEMMCEGGLNIDHSTIHRWVLHYAPELDRRCQPHLKSTNDSWRVDETYVKVKKQWKYLYRAVDSQGNTIDFLLTARRDTQAAKRFLIKALKANHNQEPRVIKVDKNPSDPPAIEQLKKSGVLPEDTELRQVRDLKRKTEQQKARRRNKGAKKRMSQTNKGLALRYGADSPLVKYLNNMALAGSSWRETSD